MPRNTRYGVSWQVVPTALERMLQGEDKARAQRVMKAMLAMTRLDIAELERAYNNEQTQSVTACPSRDRCLP